MVATRRFLLYAASLLCGAGALAVLLCGAGAGRWPAQCDASLRDEDAADAPLRGAAFLVAFFLVPLCALLQWCDRVLLRGARKSHKSANVASAAPPPSSPRSAASRVRGFLRPIGPAQTPELAATDAPETPPSVMLVAAPVAARDQVRALLRGAGRGYGPAAEADDEPSPPDGRQYGGFVI